MANKKSAKKKVGIMPKYFIECNTKHAMTFLFLTEPPTICPCDGCDDFIWREEP